MSRGCICVLGANRKRQRLYKWFKSGFWVAVVNILFKHILIAIVWTLSLDRGERMGKTAGFPLDT